jgi:hypothetical protein
MKQLIRNFTQLLFGIIILLNAQVHAQVLPFAKENRMTGLMHVQNNFQPGQTPRFNLSGITTKASKHQLDSVITFQYNNSTNSFFKKNKDEIKYDSLGRTILYENYFFNDSSGNWKLTSRNSTGYETWGYQTSLERYDNWNDALGKYGSASKSEYSFDILGNQTEAIQHIWDYDNQTFRIDTKRKYNYILNSNGEPSEKFDSIWNFNTNKFEIESKTEFIYNPILNNSQYISYNYDGTNWTPGSKFEIFFDLNNKVQLSLMSIFKDANWVLLHKNEYSYDVKGNNNSEMAFLWNSQSNEWEGNSKVNYAYDDNGNKTLISTYYWNLTQKLWVNQTKYEFSFESNGNLNTSILYYWDENSNQWINSNKSKFSFNNNYPYEDLICNYSNELFKHMLTDFSSEKWVNNTWEIENRSNYYYSSDLINGIKELGIISSTIFPNPTSGLVTITNNQIFDKVQVFDLSGKLVHSQANINKLKQLELNLSDLNNGIYFVHTETEEGKNSINKIVVYK